MEHWDRSPGIGRHLGPAYPPIRLGLTLGNLFQPEGPLAQWLDRLHALEDHGLDLTPLPSLHFTYLGFSPMLWNSAEEVPDFSDLLPLIREACCPWSLTRLRLVPLPRALLLCGVPASPQESDRRARLARKTLELGEPWSSLLRRAYDPYPVPPLIWHTALARTEQEGLPDTVRTLVREHLKDDFGTVELGVPQLALVNYSWTTRLIQET